MYANHLHGFAPAADRDALRAEYARQAAAPQRLAGSLGPEGAAAADDPRFGLI